MMFYITVDDMNDVNGLGDRERRMTANPYRALLPIVRKEAAV